MTRLSVGAWFSSEFYRLCHLIFFFPLLFSLPKKTKQIKKKPNLGSFTRGGCGEGKKSRETRKSSFISKAKKGKGAIKWRSRDWLWLWALMEHHPSASAPALGDLIKKYQQAQTRPRCDAVCPNARTDENRQHISSEVLCDSPVEDGESPSHPWLNPRGSLPTLRFSLLMRRVSMLLFLLSAHAD